jgi:tRNA modification GTPase
MRLPRGDTLRVVLAGFPNAGKSSLLNAMVGRDAALTSGVAGTTRDPVRTLCVHEGRRVEWIDLAGFCSVESLLESLRDAGAAEGERPPGAPVPVASAPETDDVIREVVRRLTRLELQSADRILWVMDPLDRPQEALREFRRLPTPHATLVVQKTDLLDEPGRHRFQRLGEEPLLVSAHQRRGLRELLRRVVFTGPSGRRPAPTHAARYLVSSHQEAALSLAEEALERGSACVLQGHGYELAASDLRDALTALEELTGKVTPDMVLGHIFSRFCVGK